MRLRVVTSTATAVALLALLVPRVALAEEQRVVTVAFTYVLPEVFVSQGDTISLTNLDRDLHSFTAVDVDDDGKPLFDSPPEGTTFGETEAVTGVEALPPGAYRFFCRFHVTVRTMHGTLHVG